VARCGPVRMFQQLSELWSGGQDGVNPALSLAEIAVKVKRFFTFYAINRCVCAVLAVYLCGCVVV
jgi:hypothetical protein